MDTEPTAPLLDLIYDAAADTGLWPAVISAVADWCASEGGVLYGQAVGERTVVFEHNGRLDDSCSTIYKERHLVNDWSLYMEHQPTGRIVVSDEVVPFERLRRTAFYDEVIRPQSLVRNAMAALAREGGFYAAFNIVRTARQGPFEAHHLERLRQVLPHLQRSLRLAYRVEGYRALQRGQQAALDRLSTGVVVLDRRARVLHANSAAEAVIRANRGLAVTAGVLACTQPAERRRLQALWQAVAGGQPAASMSLASPDGATLVLSLSSLRGRDLDRLAWLGGDGPAMLLFITDPGQAAALQAERVQQAFGLSPAEARVALTAAEGGTIAQMAADLHLSANTVKTHLSRIFGKMGVSRRSQLVSRVQALTQVQSPTAA